VVHKIAQDEDATAWFDEFPQGIPGALAIIRFIKVALPEHTTNCVIYTIGALRQMFKLVLRIAI
jgi:hypothetical protein